MQAGHMAYDRAITVFSPDGRLFQVEYAREAVKRGTTTVGVKFKDGVVLIVDKRLSSKLIEPESIEKIFKIKNLPEISIFSLTTFPSERFFAKAFIVLATAY